MRPAITLRKSLVLLLGASLLGGWVRSSPAVAAPTVTLQADARVAAAKPSTNTFAGTGSTGDSGDGGAATAALLNNPRGVAWDAVTGTVLIADTGNHRIRRVS
jgi:hypothetical protein